MKANQVNLLREISYDEDSTLDTNNLFHIKDQNRIHSLAIQQQSYTVQEHVQKIKCPFYINNYFENLQKTQNILYMHQIFDPRGESSTFYMKHYNPKDILTLQNYITLSLPLIQLVDKNKFTKSEINNAEFFINKILKKLKGKGNSEGGNNLSSL